MKKMIIGLMIGVLVVGTAIVVLWVYMQKNNIVESDDFDITEEQVDLNYTIQPVEQTGDFYRVKQCVEIYASAINAISTSDEVDAYGFVGSEEDRQYMAERLLNILGEEYKQEFSITTEKLLETYSDAQKDTKVTVINMYRIHNSADIVFYFAYGIVRDKKDSSVEPLSVMVGIDEKNKTFAIYPEEYMREHGFHNMQIGQTLTLPETETIENTGGNNSKYAYISLEEIIKNDFSMYKELILYNRETAYNMLDEEYKNKRFPTYTEFEQYVQKYSQRFAMLELSKYNIEQNGDKKQYICIDTKDNYYIFTEHGAMDFDVQLDVYTLDTPEFLTKYNAGNYQDRVVLNLNKVQEAVNQGDYRYMYNHLDETFKQNNFPTIDTFNAYMEANYFASNVFTFDSYQEAGDVASCTVKITNGDNTAESKNQTFIMKLETGTDFVMSFQL